MTLNSFLGSLGTCAWLLCTEPALLQRFASKLPLQAVLPPWCAGRRAPAAGVWVGAEGTRHCAFLRECRVAHEL